MTMRSAVTIWTRILPAISGHLLRGLDDILDAAPHVERLLRQVIVLAVQDLAETAHRVACRHEFAFAAGELGGDLERLREKALDAASTRHRQLVLLGELVDAEDGDNILKITVALEDSLDAARHIVMLLADDARLEHSAT